MFFDTVMLDIDICLSYMLLLDDLQMEFSSLGECHVCCLLHAVSFEPLLGTLSAVLCRF
jgi:hypothetical protein